MRARTRFGPESTTDMTAGDRYVTRQEALLNLADVLGTIDGPQTRGSSGPRTVRTVEALSRADLSGAKTRADESPDVPLVYLVSFGEGLGSAVLAADK